MTTIAVLGATSGIASAALRQWAGTGASVRLIARSGEKLGRLSGDLRIRGAASVETFAGGLGSTAEIESAIDWIFADGAVDTVLIAFGDMPSQDEADASAEIAAHLLTLNGSMAALAAHLVTLRLIAQGSGSLGVIGSVAGDRGRQSNYLYGSAKAMVATAVAGLQHRVALTSLPVRITLIKPGPTKTAMTAHLPKRGLASADAVAADVVKALDVGAPVVYTPIKWKVIMAVVRAVPRVVFHKSKL